MIFVRIFAQIYIPTHKYIGNGYTGVVPGRGRRTCSNTLCFQILTASQSRGGETKRQRDKDKDRNRDRDRLGDRDIDLRW